MKPKRFYYLFAAVAVCAFVCYSVAQLADSTPSPDQVKLDQVASLIAGGKPTEARELIATIPVTAPEYRIGKFYDALAIHVSGDQIGFMKALEKLPPDATGVPSNVTEDLAAREVQLLLFFRTFEELLPKARAFVQNHAGSARFAIVKDCLLAGLFDRGMKKTDEACRLKDEAIYNSRWPQAKANLEEFLALVASNGATTYRSLPKRNLQQDIWVARLTLGDENALWGEVPATDVAAREQLSFLRLRLYQRLQKDQTDRNIKMATEFLELFPESLHRKRVEYELAEVALCGGERLKKPGRQEGDPTTLEGKRATSARYLEMARELYGSVVEDPKTGIAIADVQQSRLGMVRIYFAQKDSVGLSNCVAQLIADYPAKGKVWVVAKLYYAASLYRQNNLTEAANELDEILAVEFKNNPSSDGHLVAAARWRILVAQRLGDKETPRRVVQLVQSSECVDSVKRTFLTKYQDLLTQPDPVSK